MANWCSTKIIITHESEEKIEELEKLLKNCMRTNYMENGFGLNWLGNIVGNSGIGTVDTGKQTDLRCRGYVDYINRCENELTINTETAWVPMLEMWVKLLEKYLPDAEMIYNAEEYGCGICCTNDPDLIGKYVLDSWDDEIESEYEMDSETLVKFLQEFMNVTETDVEKLLSLTYERDYEFSIHQWEEKEVSAW